MLEVCYTFEEFTAKPGSVMVKCMYTHPESERERERETEGENLPAKQAEGQRTGGRTYDLQDEFLKNPLLISPKAFVFL